MARLDGDGRRSEPLDASRATFAHATSAQVVLNTMRVGRGRMSTLVWEASVSTGRLGPGPFRLNPAPQCRPHCLLPARAGGGRWQMLLPVMGSLAMVGFAFVVHSLLYLVVIALMVVSMVGATLGAQMAGNCDERRRWARGKARYLGLVDGAAADAWRASELPAGLNGLYPGPEELFRLVKATDGTWERRRSDPDFGWVRLGLGKVRSARPVKLGDSAPAANEPDPELASAAEQLVAASAYVTSAPVSPRPCRG